MKEFQKFARFFATGRKFATFGASGIKKKIPETGFEMGDRKGSVWATTSKNGEFWEWEYILVS